MKNYKSVHSPLSDRVLLARFGKDPNTALETRDVMSEFWQALVSYSFDGVMPVEGEETEVRFGGGDEQFMISIRRMKS